MPSHPLSRAALLLFVALSAFAIGQPSYVDFTPRAAGFKLATAKACAPLFVDPADYKGVHRAAADLAADIQRVTGCKPQIVNDLKALGANGVILGTLGHSPALDQLAAAGKLDVSPIQGKWEAFQLETLSRPTDGLASALVIAGSDKRATIFGIYDLSEQIGVSPWYWWADVPVSRQANVTIKAGRFSQGEPAVKYRGIFLNDEAPALRGWADERFGGFKSPFYTKVFELILRMKGNYLWPAMWGRAFNEDDPENARLADEYGIVMGTSHHEPMLRAQAEWTKHGTGPWNYSTNEETLKAFWNEGIARNKGYESIVTIGMRGDGDLPMARGGDMAANIKLLEKIVADQRAILAKHVNPDVTKVPQLWALYKEVQDYYDKGMRVPDDVTLLWCDDNWGNIRRLPTPEERKRAGGAGIYYHFDYVGGPRNYKWLNTVPIPKIWEQMNLALEYEANRIWIVNVGDLKPMEVPIEFFLTMAWNPKRFPQDKLDEYLRLWAEREFGPKYAKDAADIVAKYTKYNGWRKPELLEPTTFSLAAYYEADAVVGQWRAIVDRAEQIYAALPPASKDAFYQLVLFPAKASAQVVELYVTAGRNRQYASQGRASTNDIGARVKALFDADAALMAEYNHKLAGGKWNHFMDQTHIGYTNWQEPPKNNMPAISELQPHEAAAIGVAVEGSYGAWPPVGGQQVTPQPILPVFDYYTKPRRYVEVFNRGKMPLEYTVKPNVPWLLVSKTMGRLDKEKDDKFWVHIDWAKAPKESATAAIKITPSGSDPITIIVNVFRPAGVPEEYKGFLETEGYIAMEAAHYARKTDGADRRWVEIPDHGRTLSSMTVLPASGTGEAVLEYDFMTFTAARAELSTILAPTLNFVPGRGLRYAVSLDGSAWHEIDALARNTNRDWEQTVKDAVRVSKAQFQLAPGQHTLKLKAIDGGLVLQRLVIDLGGARPSYFGPTESYRAK